MITKKIDWHLVERIPPPRPNSQHCQDPCIVHWGVNENVEKLPIWLLKRWEKNPGSILKVNGVYSWARHILHPNFVKIYSVSFCVILLTNQPTANKGTWTKEDKAFPSPILKQFVLPPTTVAATDEFLSGLKHYWSWGAVVALWLQGIPYDCSIPSLILFVVAVVLSIPPFSEIAKPWWRRFGFVMTEHKL